VKRILLGLVAATALGVAAVTLWMNLAPPEDVARAMLALERNRTGLEAKEVEIDGFRIAYLEGGSGEPLVLLHGFGADKYHWIRVAPYLTARFRVIAIDLPGFGESSRASDKGYAASDQVRYLHAIVGALSLESFHLGGNSMGGLISARYAVAYPGEVRTLWLLAPGGVGTGPTGELASLRPGDDIPLIVRSAADVDRVLAYAMNAPPYLPAAVKHAIGTRGGADYKLHARIFHELNAEWAAAPLERIVTGLSVPTRIVWGEEDRVLPVADADVLYSALRESSVLRLQGVGHVPQLEAAKTVATDYLAFVVALSTP
jgi:pimeloyl-ACP methyl ester carboxylesterase